MRGGERTEDAAAARFILVVSGSQSFVGLVRAVLEDTAVYRRQRAS